MYTQQLNATFQFFRASYSNRSKVAKQYNVLSSSPLSISRRENYWSESSVSPPPNTHKLSLNLWKRKIPRKMGREGGREREREDDRSMANFIRVWLRFRLASTNARRIKWGRVVLSRIKTSRWTARRYVSCGVDKPQPFSSAFLLSFHRFKFSLDFV